MRVRIFLWLCVFKGTGSRGDTGNSEAFWVCASFLETVCWCLCLSVIGCVTECVWLDERPVSVGVKEWLRVFPRESEVPPWVTEAAVVKTSARME